MRGNRVKSTAELLESSRPKVQHPIVRLCQEHGYEETHIQERGQRRELTKGEQKIVLHFFDRLFVSAFVHLSPEKNIGKLNESQLRAFFDDNLCLNEHVESWAQVRYCKGERNHAGSCIDADGTFPSRKAASVLHGGKGVANGGNV